MSAHTVLRKSRSLYGLVASVQKCEVLWEWGTIIAVKSWGVRGAFGALGTTCSEVQYWYHTGEVLGVLAHA